MPSEQYTKFREAYIDELYRRYNDPEDKDYGQWTRREYSAPATMGTSRDTATTIVDRMLRAGSKKGRISLDGNPAMKAAFRKVGITKAPEMWALLAEPDNLRSE